MERRILGKCFGPLGPPTRASRLGPWPPGLSGALWGSPGLSRALPGSPGASGALRCSPGLSRTL
eukprot:15439649-Alexandrium_andersonii.AAC.1